MENKNQFVEDTEVKDAVKVAEETVEETPKEKKDVIPAWRSVLLGAIPGAAVGAAGVLSQMEARGEDSAADIDNAVVPPVDPGKVEDAPVFVPVVEVRVAEGVDDSMNFAEAFSTARAEVGAGGAFTWHGDVYSTYYGTEWNAMSPVQQSQYGNALSSTDIKVEPYVTESEPAPDPVPVPDFIEGEIAIEDVATVYTQGGSVDVAEGYVGDHAALFVDGDRDDVIDAVAIDVNDNLEVEPEEVFEPSEDIHMSDLADMADGPVDDVVYQDV